MERPCSAVAYKCFQNVVDCPLLFSCFHSDTLEVDDRKTIAEAHHYWFQALAMSEATRIELDRLDT